jgi:signal transduction histidine kinase
MSRPTPSEQFRERFSVPELLDTICHDVRATLAVTAGSATELGSTAYGPLSDVQRQLVAIIQRGNGRLARLANNLMQISDLWAGQLEPKPTRCDLRNLVAQLLEETQRADTPGRIHTRLELPTEPVEVQVDLERTRHALANPIGIAMAVARRELTIGLFIKESTAELVVEDDGPDRTQGRRPQGAKRVSSTELALAVSQALLALQGGELTAESPLTKAGGCRVVIRLPRLAGST